MTAVDEQTAPAQGGAPSPITTAAAMLREVLVVVVAALVISFLAKTFLVQAFWIPSASMQNTLVPGDRVVVSKLTPGPFDIKRGDVVVFADPGGWLTSPADDAALPTPSRGVVATAALDALTFVGIVPADSRGHLIKRVIGLPGDVVACAGAGAPTTINGTPIQEVYLAPGAAPSQVAFSVTVPAGHLWVEGDNRGDSLDSRAHQDLPDGGSVPESLVVGRAVATVWPITHWGWLSDHPGAFADVHPPAAG